MHRNDCYQTLQGFEVFPLDYTTTTTNYYYYSGIMLHLSVHASLTVAATWNGYRQTGRNEVLLLKTNNMTVTLLGPV